MTDETPAGHQVFVSFSSHDRDKATRIYEGLERAGLRCWISLRDVGPGQNFQSAIVQAIQSAKVLVLVFSSHTNNSDEINKELALASAFKVNVIPFRIEDVQPGGALLYELATRQWINAFDSWDAALAELAAAARRAIAPGSEPPRPRSSPDPVAVQPRPVSAPPSVNAASSLPEEALETARAALAPYLGPIARVLVRKHAAEAASVRDLHERLAAQIPSTQDRSAFLRRVAGSQPARQK